MMYGIRTLGAAGPNPHLGATTARSLDNCRHAPRLDRNALSAVPPNRRGNILNYVHSIALLDTARRHK